MERVRDYDALICELLAGVAGDLVKGWESQVEEWKEWFDRGNKLFELGRFEEAITSYDRAIRIKPDFYEAFHDRGVTLCDNLRDYGRALESFDRAIEIQPDSHKSWYCRGVVLEKLERSEEAIASYDRAVKIQPNFSHAWNNRGTTLQDLGRSEEAITSYDRAVKIQPNSSHAWYNRGNVIFKLGRYEEAIVSYDRAIKINADFHEALCNRGVALRNLGRYKEAIASYDRAIKIKCDYHEAWHNRGIAIGILHGYQAEINAYHQAFKHIKSESHPEGWGFLQHWIGRAHYQEGKDRLFSNHKNPQHYYHQALANYQNVLQTLTREEFPKLRLETLIDTAKAHLAKHNNPAAHQCKTEAFEILQDLLNAQPTFAGKKRIQIEYNSLRQLDVDLFIGSGDNINALVAAELDKNNCLTWLLSALAETTISPEYARMQQLLATTDASAQTGIVYSLPARRL